MTRPLAVLDPYDVAAAADLLEALEQIRVVAYRAMGRPGDSESLVVCDLVARLRAAVSGAAPTPVVEVAHLIGNAEVRLACGGISRSTLLDWRARRGFPAPVSMVGYGCWDRRQVEDWARRNLR